ncbi:MAG TPA: hypothetical protein VFL96_04840 [Acidobacteriaceae bacterium]|nr:hypothetical protein [Acidobacteriaceae bacterium]
MRGIPQGWADFELFSQSKKIFDSVIVVTDRRVQDRQIKETIRQFAEVSATVGHAEHSGDLRRFLRQGKKSEISRNTPSPAGRYPHQQLASIVPR